MISINFPTNFPLFLGTVNIIREIILAFVSTSHYFLNMLLVVFVPIVTSSLSYWADMNIISGFYYEINIDFFYTSKWNLISQMILLTFSKFPNSFIITRSQNFWFLSAKTSTKLFYGAEFSTTAEAILERLKSFKMWIRILRISQTEHIINIVIMRRLRKKKEVVFTVNKRNMDYFGLIFCHDKYRLLNLVVQCKMESKRRPGRRRYSWLQILHQWFRLFSVDLFRNKADKIRIVKFIPKVCNR